MVVQCSACSGYYGPARAGPLCRACHSFLYEAGSWAVGCQEAGLAGAVAALPCPAPRPAPSHHTATTLLRLPLEV